MPTKKQSRKNTNTNTKTVTQPMAAATTNDDDDGFGSILIKSNTSSRSSTRSKKSVETPPTPDWELAGMTKEDYEAMQDRVYKQMREYQLENYKESMIADLDSFTYWIHRIESLEKQRETYNKKRSWSAEAIAAVDEIDAQIRECEDNIDRLEEMDYYYGECISAY